MPDKQTLLDLLPVRNQVVLTEDRQNTGDIRDLILAKHKEYAPDYDLISDYFDTGNIIDTSRGIFDFLKQNVPYHKESGRYQTVKSPALILSDNDGTGNYDRVDCKNYASFICGVLDSLKRAGVTGFDWCYRFASYDESDPEPGHVFAVVKIGGKELWIDPVFPYFNDGTMHEWELDKTPAIGGLYSISGPPVATGSVTVNTQDAAKNFLVAVNLNLFALPALMLSYPDITTSPQVQKVLTDSGVDLNTLAIILKTYING